MFALAQVVTGREGREQRRIVLIKNVVKANGVAPEQASAPDLEDHRGRDRTVPSEPDDVVIPPVHLLDTLLTRQTIQSLDHVPELGRALEVEHLRRSPHAGVDLASDRFRLTLKHQQYLVDHRPVRGLRLQAHAGRLAAADVVV